MNDLIPRAPKRKKQPTAECHREQLRLAADRIIELQTLLELQTSMYKVFSRGQRAPITSGTKQKSFWRRILRMAA